MSAHEASGRDLSDQAERLRTDRRYRSIFNSASVGLCETDLSQIRAWLDTLSAQDPDIATLLRERSELPAEVAGCWRIREINDAALRLLGARRGQDLPESLGEIVAGGSKSTWRDLLIAIASHAPTFEFELSLGTLEGEKEALFTLSIPADRADFGNVVVSMLDITERKRLERELWSLQRMEAIGSLTGGVAHDFNNLLMVIGSYAGFLLDQLGDGEPARDDVMVIRDATRRAAALTNQLLAFSRRQVQHLEILNLNDTISELETVLRSAVGEHIELVIRLHKELGLIKADRSQIEQVLMHLVVNARDAMAEGGTLAIETANAQIDGRYVRPEAVPPGSYVMLSVTDSGGGMDEETRLRIFEPFFSTKERGRGTGLGLSTVYGIVKQSKGHIYVHTEMGRGTAFETYLPCLDESRSLFPAPTSVGPGPRGGETVLLVEDDPGVRIATRRIMESHGYRVLEASQGPEALFLAQAQEGAIDLLVTDVVMPHMKGDELAKRLAKERPAIKVLFVSGYTETTLAHECAFERGTTFVQKPFSPHVLLRKVREVLDGG
jgi:two-component system, cell cycle sensor histidine kinase and response regulator CckA